MSLIRDIWAFLLVNVRRVNLNTLQKNDPGRKNIRKGRPILDACGQLLATYRQCQGL